MCKNVEIKFFNYYQDVYFHIFSPCITSVNLFFTIFLLHVLLHYFKNHVLFSTTPFCLFVKVNVDKRRAGEKRGQCTSEVSPQTEPGGQEWGAGGGGGTTGRLFHSVNICIQLSRGGSVGSGWVTPPLGPLSQ